MNRFKKNLVIIIIIELLFILVADVVYFRMFKEPTAFYKVEAERLVRAMSGDVDMQQSPGEINLSEYKSLIRVSVFDSNEICNNDYLVKEVDGTLYRIEYEVKRDNRPFIMMNVVFK